MSDLQFYCSCSNHEYNKHFLDLLQVSGLRTVTSMHLADVVVLLYDDCNGPPSPRIETLWDELMQRVLSSDVAVLLVGSSLEPCVDCSEVHVESAGCAEVSVEGSHPLTTGLAEFSSGMNYFWTYSFPLSSTSDERFSQFTNTHWRVLLRYASENILVVHRELKVVCLPWQCYGSELQDSSLAQHDYALFRNLLQWLQPPSPALTLSQDLAMTLTPDFGDVTFECEGKHLWACKAVICCRAAYFVGMFGSQMQEAQDKDRIIHVEEPYETFRALLAYLTTGQLPTSSDSLLQLLVLVDKYGVSDMVPSVVRHIRNSLRPDNIISFLVQMEGLCARYPGLAQQLVIFLRDYRTKVTLADLEPLRGCPEVLHLIVCHTMSL
eukprot:GGOE01001267.1.p1 GENE.GGOE01001267.1~~GGOE01001267.1.p1  ORF type:complete len:388 (-),score=114.30 GGOE01001267.1:204-1340(-)